MARSFLRTFMVCVLSVTLVQLIGCGGGNTGTGNNGTGGTGTGTDTDTGNTGNDSNIASLTPVRTDIEMHTDKRIEAGDDIVVFGYGGFAGVDYIIPSDGDTEGRGIPGGENFVAGAFAVTGKKIILQSNFEVSVFDAETETMTSFTSDDVRLTNTPSGLYDQGHIQADGDFAAFRTDGDDDLWVKALDMRNATPQVVAFAVNPTANAFGVDHVMVDGDDEIVIAVADGSFWVYDINNPTMAPTEYAIANGIGDTIPKIDDGVIIFHDDETSPNASLLDLDTGEVTMLGTNPSTYELSLAKDSYAYFVDTDSEDSLGGAQRSGIGKVSGGDPTLATKENFIDGSTTNNGAFGFAETVAITPDGSMVFLGGSRSVGSGEYIQVSTSGSFTVLADPKGEDRYGLPGGDVSVSSNTLAFKTGENTDTTVGYIILDN